MALGSDASLLLRIKGDASDAVRALKDTETGAKSLTGATGSLGSSLAAVAGPAAIAATVVAGIGAAAISVTSKLFDLAKAAADYGSSINDAAEKTGASTDSLQALKFAAEQSGSSFEGVTNAVAKFNVLLGNAATGNDKAEKILKQYGITAKDTDGALIQAISTIATMTDSTQQAAAAGALFKDRTGEILPVIKSFDGDLPGLIQKLSDLGLIMSKDAVKAADEFDDQMKQLNDQLATVGRTIGIAVMPTFLKFANALSTWLAENKVAVKAWAQAIGDAFSLAGKFLVRLYDDGRRAYAVLQAIAAIQQGGPAGLANAIAIMQGIESQIATDQERRNRVSPTAGAGGRPRGTGPTTLDAGGGTSPHVPKGDTRTDKQVYQDFVAELKKLGVTINSGFRTYAEQARLFASLPRGQAARPGTSDHEFYRAVDLPANISRDLLQKAANAAGVILEKSLVHQGTGLHLHQPFRKGKAEGGGEDDLAKELEHDTKLRIENAHQAMDEELAIYESGLKKKTALEAEHADELNLTQDDLAIHQEARNAEALAKRKTELEKYIIFLKTQGPAGVEKLHDAEQKLKLLEDDIEINRATNAVNQQKRDREQAERDADKAIKAQQEWEKEQDREAERNRRTPVTNIGEELPGLVPKTLADTLRTTVGSGSEISALFQLQDYFAGEGNTQVLAGLEALTGAFQGVGQAVGQTIAAFVLYGNAGASVRQVTAQILASIAQQAAVKAIFELAEGFAALALAFFGIPNAGPSATAHFTAAAIYGGIAGVAAVAGRAVAGDSFKKQTSAAGVSTGSGGGNRGAGQGSAYSSFGNDPLIRGAGANEPSRPAIALRISVDGDSYLAKALKFDVDNNGPTRGIIRSAIEA